MRTFGQGARAVRSASPTPTAELAFAFLTNGELSPDFVVWRYRLQGLAFKACVD
jgi:hypothetical protein